jgi:amino acid adenylation domain-containing protein
MTFEVSVIYDTGFVRRAVSRLLSEAAARVPDRQAVRDAHGAVTFAELVSLADAAAAWMHDRGVRRGDRVLVRASPHRTTVALLFAALRLGVVFVPFGTDVTRYQLNALVADAAPALLVTDDDRQLEWLDCPCATVRELPSAVASEVPESAVAPHDLALLLYTSGSTAQPRAVACTHAQVSFAAAAVASQVRYHEDDVVYCRLPLSFDYGLYQIFLAFMAGATVVLADSSARDARLLSDVNHHGATVVPLVPSMATMLLTLAARKPGSSPVRLFTNTGEHLPASTADELRRAFPGASVQLMFGTTECKRITVLEPDGDRDRPGSVGRALPGTEVRILDADGREVPAGEIGEISVRGRHLMAGYWRAPELTAARYRIDESGERFLLTGDFGYLDPDGYLYFTGRRDDLFKLRGIRTSAVEIEDAALSVPGVSAAAVLPPTGGGQVVLCAVATLSQQDILRELLDRIGPMKVPQICRIFPALPLTANGKVDKRRLRQLCEEATV